MSGMFCPFGFTNIPQICIVGAGIAGLSAGYTCKKLGMNYHLKILEAASILGGRIQNARNENFSSVGFPVPLGAEWIHVDPKILNEITGDNDTADKVQTVYHKMNPFQFWTFHSFFVPLWIPTAILGHNYKWVNFSWFDFLNEFLVPSVQNDIFLNKQVTRINYEDESVIKIYTKQDDIYECDRVIVTVSLQMLKDETIQFEPPLSKEKKDALEGALMPSGLKIFIEFKEKFYPTSFNHANRLAMMLDGEGGYFDAAYGQATDKHVLGLIAVGNEYVRPYFEHKGAPDMISFVLSELDKMFKGKASPNFIQWTMEDWTPESKPFVRGAYSWEYKNPKKDIKILSSPIQERIYFAGEALPLDREKIGYAHNAALSGKHAASLICSNTL